jgi:hypothetical protein
MENKIGLEKGTHPFCVKHLYIRSRNGLEPSWGPQFIIESISSFITTNDLFCNGTIQHFIKWMSKLLVILYFMDHLFYHTYGYKKLQTIAIWTPERIFGVEPNCLFSFLVAFHNHMNACECHEENNVKIFPPPKIHLKSHYHTHGQR